jgi:hypothetical protein
MHNHILIFISTAVIKQIPDDQFDAIAPGSGNRLRPFRPRQEKAAHSLSANSLLSMSPSSPVAPAPSKECFFPVDGVY